MSRKKRCCHGVALGWPRAVGGRTGRPASHDERRRRGDIDGGEVGQAVSTPVLQRVRERHCPVAVAAPAVAAAAVAAALGQSAAAPLCLARGRGSISVLCVRSSIFILALASACQPLPSSAFESDFDRWGWSYPPSTCGSWHSNYTQLHRVIRTAARQVKEAAQGDGAAAALPGASPPPSDLVRFATYSCDSLSRCGGVGDVLLGVFSTFLVALLQNRALVVDHPLLQHAFQPASVDWHMGDDVPRGQERAVDINDPNEVAQPGEVLYVNLQDTLPLDPESLFTRLSAASNLRIRWNRGVSTRIVKQGGGWSRLMHELGLRLPVTFGCVMRFLLRPNMDILRAVDQQAREIQRPGVSSICIHTRTPDEMTWTNRGEVLSQADSPVPELLQWTRSKLLACAQKVEDFWLPGDVPVRWVFLSNSRDIKDAVVNEYGDKILTTGITPLHTAMVRATAARVVSWQSSVAEWLLLTRCSLFVVTESGFSKTAALFSLRPLAVYLLARHHYRSARNQWTDSCDPERPASFDLLGERWSGI